MAEGEITNSGPDGSWQFDPRQDPSEPDVLTPSATAIPPTGADGSISWTASEFIAHHKSRGWYLALAACAVFGALVVWLLTKDEISATAVLLGAVFFGIYAARKPRQLPYLIDGQGLTISDRHYPYQSFRSFAIVPEGAFNSIELVPLKRFAPLTTIYYDPTDETKIVALLSNRLPMEQRQKDLLERFMWRIRF